jgi:hypothetical protein
MVHDIRSMPRLSQRKVNGSDASISRLKIFTEIENEFTHPRQKRILTRKEVILRRAAMKQNEEGTLAPEICKQ